MTDQDVYVTIHYTGTENVCDGAWIVGVFKDEQDAHRAAKEYAAAEDCPLRHIEVQKEKLQ